MSDAHRQELISALQGHVGQFTTWFNEAAARERLGVTIDPNEVIEDIGTARYRHLKVLAATWKQSGVHKEQVETAVQAIARTISNPGSSGIVLGALQSGKTGTAFMTLFAAPVHFLKTKVTYVPLFMTTNQNSHLAQTQSAMRGFFDLYGDLKIVSDGKVHSLIDYYAQSGSDLVPSDDENEITLNDYTDRVTEEMYPGENRIEKIVQDMTVKRVPGEISKKVRSYCQRAREFGHGVMMIVDEPQYGASNQTVRNGQERPTLLSRAFREIDEDFFSPDTPHFMVGLSATPFDTASLDNLWLVKQRLNSGYVGPNVFGGQRIDETVITSVPRVLSFKELSKSKELEWFNEMPYLIGAARGPDKKTFKATKVNENGVRVEMNALERRQKGADLVRLMLDGILPKRQEKASEPQGALLRIANNTRLTEDVLDAMGLDAPDSPYNLIRFYQSSGDIKSIIWEATRKDKRPYVVVTVGKGRMGDAFPGSTVLGVDLTQTPSDANAFLQGVFGRMCGYGKNSPVVVVSNQSKDLFVQYMENNGSTSDFRESKHTKQSTVKKGRRQGESYFMITDEMIDSDHEDSPLRAFRKDIVAYLEKQELSKETTKVDVPQRANQFVNLPEMMEKHGIIEYVAANSMRLDPELRDPARIVKFGDTTLFERRDHSQTDIGYTMNDAGECRVLVSKVAYNSADTTYESGLQRGKRREPAKHVNRGRRHDTIMPVITVKKVDANGAVVPLEQSGRFAFDGMVFHLEEKIRRYRPAENITALMNGHAFAPALSDREKAERLAVFISAHMSGKREHSFLEAMGMADVQAVMGSIYDRSTHVYDVRDNVISIISLETREIDNPNGPAVMDLTDFRNVIVDPHMMDEDDFAEDLDDDEDTLLGPDGDEPEDRPFGL